MVSLRIRRPVTGSVLVVVTGPALMPMTGRVLVVVAVEMVEIAAGVPAATANEVDREHDRHYCRKQDHVRGVGKDLHARKVRRRDRACETPARGTLCVPLSSTPVPLAGDSAGRDAG